MPNVQVAVRMRPVLGTERESPTAKIEASETNNTIRIVTGSSQQQANAKLFSFDRVLDTTATQDDVFEYVRPMVEHALDGLHATIFAYGQTGSGKTFTMEGLQYAADAQGRPRPKLDTPPEHHGILPRVIQSIFDLARARCSHNPNIAYRLKCSFTQLYNERVSDLLNPAMRSLKEGLKIRWTRDDHFQVENLYVFECENPEQMREMFHLGVKEKVMGSHSMNMQSSRSHCLFTIHVHSWDPKAPECVVKSELTLVDLAGSEKLALLSQNPSQQLLKESIEINTSLLSLGKVITALATNTKSTAHIPYRDSKLTKLLKHALGGNSMTVMLACISPLDSSVDETMSTLLYAGRARNITNDPRVNEDPRSALIRQLREEIKSLKSELDYYRQLVATSGGGIDEKFGAPSTAKLGAVGSAGIGSGAADLIGRRPSSYSGGMSPRDESNLADKLLESCKMLKNVVSINGQLRTAFDKLKQAKEESEKREVELNAENISLRERIEMLESIALRGDEDSDSNNNSTSLPPSTHQTKIAATLQYAQQPQLLQFQPPQQQQPAAVSAKLPNDPPQGQRASQHPRNDSSPHVALRQTFSERLNDYAKKYRNPAQPSNYEDYYGQAKKAVSGQSGASGSASQLVQEMDRLLRNVPKSTLQMVPASLQTSQAFGSLAFGGTDNEKQDLEERRRQRQLKLQQLQDHHNTMQRGFSGGVPNVLSLAPTYPPSATSDVSGPPPLNFSSSGPTTNTGKLFAYLSQEETSKTFTQEQLERLRLRNSLHTPQPTVPTPSTPKSSKGGAPLLGQPSLRLGQPSHRR